MFPRKGSNARMMPVSVPMSRSVILIARIHLIRLGALRTAAVIKHAAFAHGRGILRFRIVEKVADRRLDTAAPTAALNGHGTACARTAVVSRVGDRDRSVSAGDA